ncbi:hypothetical protein [Cellulosilyticum ruminicola]|uniref:hypothetical protein n=1 Tax=Cellulosilyticum ruminicola TaxID=425254 RepID=UPI0006D18A22|nr:hypothetical protein [Cellulosilyticum ruminicola]
MNTHANELKKCILEIIRKMSNNPQEFFNSEKACFVCQSKFGLEKLMQFSLSFGSNSLDHEIGEFFEYSDGFPTTSAFVQQRKKMSYEVFKL